MSLWKEFRFEAAHLLPNMPRGHKCARLHGHSFHLEVHLEGPVDPHTGMLVDYAEIKQAFGPLEEQLDHRYLNERPWAGEPDQREHRALDMGALEARRCHNYDAWSCARPAPSDAYMKVPSEDER